MLREALPHIRRALEIDPGYRAFRNYRRIIGQELAVVSIQLGRHRDAAVHVHERVTELPGQNDWTAAVLLGMCASRWAADTITSRRHFAGKSFPKASATCPP